MNKQSANSIESQIQKVLTNQDKKAKTKTLEFSNYGDGNITINYDANEYEAKIAALEKDRLDAREVIDNLNRNIEILNKNFDILKNNLYGKDEVIKAKDELIKELRKELHDKNKIIEDQIDRIRSIGE